jgi:hypothetical protein
METVNFMAKRFKTVGYTFVGKLYNCAVNHPSGLRLNKKAIFFFFFFFFKLPFPFFAIRLLRYLSVGRFSNSCSLFLCLSVMRRGSGALSPATHAHSTSHSQTYTTTFIHPWAPFPTGLEPVLTSRWWPKEC